VGIKKLPETLLIGWAEFGDRLQEKVEGNGEVEGLAHSTYSVSAWDSSLGKGFT
jgi:hypothetical protein